jgi:hypothetical protein
MSHLPLVLALTLATGIAVATTVVQATVATPAKPAHSICTPVALS